VLAILLFQLKSGILGNRARPRSVANHTKVPAKISDQCRLYAVTGGRIKKAAPTSDLTPLKGKNMDPFRFKQLLSIYGRRFFPAQDGDVLTSLYEFPWLKGMDVVCLGK
jgi:hypothetical protein